MKALQEFGLSQREACRIVHAHRRSSREQPTTKAQRDAIVATRLTEVAQAHAEHGCRRIFAAYERNANDSDQYLNYKAFRRIYRLVGLQIGRLRRRGRAKIVRGRSLRRATKPFEGWTLDLIHDRLFNGRAFRGLTMMDEFSRCGLALELNYSFPSRSVISVLDEVARTYGYPKYLRIDNGTELTSKIMQLWSEEHCVELLFIQPGKPTQNAFIESFKLARASRVFKRALVSTLRDAADEWRHAYHTTHAHSARLHDARGIPRDLRNHANPTVIRGCITGPIPPLRKGPHNA